MPERGRFRPGRFGAPGISRPLVRRPPPGRALRGGGHGGGGGLPGGGAGDRSRFVRRGCPRRRFLRFHGAAPRDAGNVGGSARVDSARRGFRGLWSGARRPVGPSGAEDTVAAGDCPAAAPGPFPIRLGGTRGGGTRAADRLPASGESAAGRFPSFDGPDSGMAGRPDVAVQAPRLCFGRVGREDAERDETGPRVRCRPRPESGSRDTRRFLRGPHASGGVGLPGGCPRITETVGESPCPRQRGLHTTRNLGGTGGPSAAGSSSVAPHYPEARVDSAAADPLIREVAEVHTGGIPGFPGHP